MITKKLILTTLLIIIICVCSLAAAAYATGENEIDHAAAACRDIGVLRGGIRGVDEEYLSSFTTRLQAMHVTARLMGKESVALSYVWTSNFNDAMLVDYESGRNLLAYVKSHPNLGWQGDQAGNINPYGFMTAQSMYKVLLSVLGYVPEEDFTWDETLAFADKLGMRALAFKRGYLTNNDIAYMLTEALKTRLKGSEDTLCERLTKPDVNVIDTAAAYTASMLPGSPGFMPLISYREGGPLLVEVVLELELRKITIKFNTALNPTYAKALKNYSYYVPGTGYNPLPSKCLTSMLDENTVVIQFPIEGWVFYNNKTESDAFLTYIATDRKNELRASGLLDVDGASLRDLFIDIPAADLGDVGKNEVYSGSGGSATSNTSQYLR